MLNYASLESALVQVEDLKLFFSNKSTSSKGIGNSFGEKGWQVLDDFAQWLTDEQRSHIATMLEEIKNAIEELASGKENAKMIQSLLDRLGDSARPVYRTLKSIPVIAELGIS